MSKTRKAILVVSFGTSFPDTCKKTIDVIEQRIGEHFSDYKIYRAWTSKMIMQNFWNGTISGSTT